MSSYVQERFHPIQCPANTSTHFGGNGIGGFLCVTSGSITINRNDGTVVIPALAVTAGIFYPLPFFLGVPGGVIITSGGAVGVLGVA